MMEYVDVCIANESDARDIFGIKAPGTDVENGILDVDGYRYVAKQMCNMFGFKISAITLRESISASHNNWSGLLYDGEDDALYISRKYPIQLVDRVGGGDSFAAGLIYSLINNRDMQSSVEFAVASSCLKQTIPGDLNCTTEDEVESLVLGNTSGRVQR